MTIYGNAGMGVFMLRTCVYLAWDPLSIDPCLGYQRVGLSRQAVQALPLPYVGRVQGSPLDGLHYKGPYLALIGLVMASLGLGLEEKKINL